MSSVTGAAGTVANTGVRTGLGLPGIAHPLLAPAEWAGLARSGAFLDWVVLDVDSGPGVCPDTHCLAAAGRLRGAGVRVLGHLDVRHGARPFAELVTDARRYADWYRADGFLLENCPTGRASLPGIRRLVDTLREIRDRAHIVLGHGTHPYPGYAENADQLVTYRGAWSDYRWSEAAEWTAHYPPDMFCHFVHGVPRGHLDEALRIARWQGAATVCLTDLTDRGGLADPWECLPGYWDDLISRIGTGVSE